jgi:uncharacterized protein YbjT (DUF2867 family)
MTILVVGGTGELGGRVAALLHEQSEEVRCLVRPGSDDKRLRTLGIEVIRGDLTDPASLPAACTGISTVVATATVLGRRLAGARRPTIHEVDEVGMTALVSAADQADVERFVYVSYSGVHAGLGFPLERAKLAVERRLAASRMRTVVVRPEAFQEIHLGPVGKFDIAQGTVAVFGKGDTKQRWVSTDDVAALLAGVVAEADPPALIEFGGPEAISRNEAVAIAEQATGRTFKSRHLPRAAARLGMHLLTRPNDAMASIFGTGLLQDLVESRSDDSALRLRGITPTAASEFIRSQALG